jgi:hypothetical protein
MGASELARRRAKVPGGPDILRGRNAQLVAALWDVFQKCDEDVDGILRTEAEVTSLLHCVHASDHERVREDTELLQRRREPRADDHGRMVHTAARRSVMAAATAGGRSSKRKNKLKRIQLSFEAFVSWFEHVAVANPLQARHILTSQGFSLSLKKAKGKGKQAAQLGQAQQQEGGSDVSGRHGTANSNQSSSGATKNRSALPPSGGRRHRTTTSTNTTSSSSSSSGIQLLDRSLPTDSGTCHVKLASWVECIEPEAEEQTGCGTRVGNSAYAVVGRRSQSARQRPQQQRHTDGAHGGAAESGSGPGKGGRPKSAPAGRGAVPAGGARQAIMARKRKQQMQKEKERGNNKQPVGRSDDRRTGVTGSSTFRPASANPASANKNKRTGTVGF